MSSTKTVGDFTDFLNQFSVPEYLPLLIANSRVHVNEGSNVVNYKYPKIGSTNMIFNGIFYNAIFPRILLEEQVEYESHVVITKSMSGFPSLFGQIKKRVGDLDANLPLAFATGVENDEVEYLPFPQGIVPVKNFVQALNSLDYFLITLDA